MAQAQAFGGQCHCGAVRFEYGYSDASKPVFNGWCHCSLCRSLNGATGVHLLAVPPAAFKIVKVRS
jgi:hypothetical protein